MQGHLTTVSESLLSPIPDESMLRTPSAIEGQGGAITEAQSRERGRMLQVRDQMAQLAAENGLKVSPAIEKSMAKLPTPLASDAYNSDLISSQHVDGSMHSVSLAQLVKRDDLLPTPAVGHIRNHDEPIENYLDRRKDYEEGRTKGMPGASLGVAVRMEMLPTPVVRNYKDGSAPQTRDEKVSTDTVARAIFNSGEVLLPTPNTMEHREIKTPEQIAELKAKSPGGYRNLREEVINEATSWGKFAPAIRRWEKVINREAPAPTKPDGKDGSHRLSSLFTEWMMGLPDGWITDVGLSRVEELKACGNGVVPQQAELALKILLQNTDLNKL